MLRRLTDSPIEGDCKKLAELARTSSYVAVPSDGGPTTKQGLRAVASHRATLILLDQAAVSITNFSTGILIGRFCPKAELGLYMLGYSVLLFAIALQQMAISSPFIALRPRMHGAAAQDYTSGAYSQHFLFSGALSLTLAVISLMLWSRQPALSSVLLTYALAAPFMLFKEMFRRVCFSSSLVGRALAVDSLVGVVQLMGLFVVTRTGRMSAVTGVLTVACATSLLLASWLLRGRKGVSFSVEKATSVFVENWLMARWIIGSQLLWAASLYSYPWLISHFRNTAAAGVWAACFGINALGNPLMLGLQNFIEPKVAQSFAHGGLPAMRQLVWRSTIVLLASMLAFSACIGLTGAHAVVLLYGLKYAGNGLTVTLIALSFALGSGGFAFSCGFFVTGQGRLDMRISWVYPLLLLLCGIPFVSRFGPLGGALSLAIVNTISTGLRAIQFRLTFRASPLSA